MLPALIVLSGQLALALALVVAKLRSVNHARSVVQVKGRATTD